MQFSSAIVAAAVLAGSVSANPEPQFPVNFQSIAGQVSQAAAGAGSSIAAAATQAVGQGGAAVTSLAAVIQSAGQSVVADISSKAPGAASSAMAGISSAAGAASSAINGVVNPQTTMASSTRPANGSGTLPPSSSVYTSVVGVPGANGTSPSATNRPSAPGSVSSSAGGSAITPAAYMAALIGGVVFAL